SDLEIAQILRLHERRRTLEQRPRRRGLGKRDDVTERRRTGEQHRDAVQTEGDATVRRCSRSQPLEEKAKPRLRGLLVDPEQLEHARLHSRITDTNTASA